jgi:hypothetical protein
MLGFDGMIGGMFGVILGGIFDGTFDGIFGGIFDCKLKFPEPVCGPIGPGVLCGWYCEPLCTGCCGG